MEGALLDFYIFLVNFYFIAKITWKKLTEDFFDVVASFGRYFPAVNVKFLLIFF